MCPPVALSNGDRDATDSGDEVDEVDDDVNGDEQEDALLDSFGEEEEESLDGNGQEQKLEYSKVFSKTRTVNLDFETSALPKVLLKLFFLLKFDPPLYKQRYSTVMELLQDERWIQGMTRIVVCKE